MSDPFAILDAPFAAMMRAIDAPGMTTAALKKTNDAHEYAQSVAESNKHARSAQYGNDPMKRAEVLTEWLHTPSGRQTLMLLDDDLAEYGKRSLEALDRGLLELAAQDIYDEQMGNE